MGQIMPSPSGSPNDYKSQMSESNRIVHMWLHLLGAACAESGALVLVLGLPAPETALVPAYVVLEEHMVAAPDRGCISNSLPSVLSLSHAFPSISERTMPFSGALESHLKLRCHTVKVVIVMKP